MANGRAGYRQKGISVVDFQEEAAEVGERSSERMSFRTKPRIKRAIQRAAALSGVNDSIFTMSAAYRAAVEIIEEHESRAVRPRSAK